MPTVLPAYACDRGPIDCQCETPTPTPNDQCARCLRIIAAQVRARREAMR